MRIVIDMQGAQTACGLRGIDNSTIYFIKAVAHHRGNHEVILALNGLLAESIEPIRTAFNGILPQKNIRLWHLTGPIKSLDERNATRQKAAELVRESFLYSLQPDIIHITSFFEDHVCEEAITSIKKWDKNSIVSISICDLIPLTSRVCSLDPNPSYAKYYLEKIDNFKKADIFFAKSEYIKKETIAHLEINKETIHNISCSFDPVFCKQEFDTEKIDSILEKFKIKCNFLLCSGTVDLDEKLPSLIEAYSMLDSQLRSKYQLVFCGTIQTSTLAELQEFTRKKSIQDNEICLVGDINRDDLLILYNICSLFVYPSISEDFGLPILEAMACGAPVIAANCASFSEVLACDEALFDPLRPESISNKITQALSDKKFREKLLWNALQRSKLFSWDRCAKNAWKHWQTAHSTEQHSRQARLNLKNKPRLISVGPLPPEHSGIAAYNVDLLNELSKYYDLDLVVIQDNVRLELLPPNCCIRNLAWLKSQTLDEFRVIYHMGNSPFHFHMLDLVKKIPGIVVLHDFYLGHILYWLHHCYKKNTFPYEYYLSHGYESLQTAIKSPQKAIETLPASYSFISYCTGLISHSNYLISLLKNAYPNSDLANIVHIPHLRKSTDNYHNGVLAKETLGIDKDAFIISSFGHVIHSKQGHRIIDSFLNSSLGNIENVHLVFVGGISNEYFETINDRINTCGLTHRINITGYVEKSDYNLYLQASDIAIQLRNQSRGETSGAILDCMNFGLPTIVNANGSISEIDPDSVLMLANEFKDSDLIHAIEHLWNNPQARQEIGQNARNYILNKHQPAYCAGKYYEFIEDTHIKRHYNQPSMINKLTNDIQSLDDASVMEDLAANLKLTFPLPTPQKRIFLDVTQTAHIDLKTGIERVVKSLVIALINNQPHGYRIEPVSLCNASGKWEYFFSRKFTSNTLNIPAGILSDEPVIPQPDDILIILDISGQMLIDACHQGLFNQFRSSGVKIYSLIHDIMPIEFPDVFQKCADIQFKKWFSIIVNISSIITSSKCGSERINTYLSSGKIPCPNREGQTVIGWNQFGADFENESCNTGISDEQSRSLAIISNNKINFLMVGTIEPRKGHLQIIDAFTLLWEHGYDFNLVIVGKEGWKTLHNCDRRNIPETVYRIRSHKQLNQHLFWFEDVNDEYLTELYKISNCLISASYDEGFGLPLIEAAQHHIPILTRDIPVFREIAGKFASYFFAENSIEAASAIESWVHSFLSGQIPEINDMPWKTWEQSACNFLNIVLSHSNQFQ